MNVDTGASSGPSGRDQELGEDTGARWVTFAWRLAPWMLSVFLRGLVACGIDATPVLNWGSGCIYTAGSGIDHVISVVGWGKDAAQGQYWIVRKWARQWICPVVLKAWRATSRLTTARFFAGDSAKS